MPVIKEIDAVAAALEQFVRENPLIRVEVEACN